MAALFRLCSALLLLLASALASEASVSQGEYDIKAAFVFNFARYVTWPPGVFPEPNAPLVLGLLAEDPLGEVMEALAGKTVQGRRLEDLKTCQLVFLSDAESKRLAAVMETLKGLPVLTVLDEVRDFEKSGGIINLITVDNKIHFEINREAARRAGLHFGSQLLSLAQRLIP